MMEFMRSDVKLEIILPECCTFFIMEERLFLQTGLRKKHRKPQGQKQNWLNAEDVILSEGQKGQGINEIIKDV